ncbi:hypothetical protein [Streptomyces sp. NPDC021562]|uniref:hypothetical protein n=1 Tax=Streptomyces sp. NPDC021562 TaxID=3155121 RepID=UPI0033ED7892
MPGPRPATRRPRPAPDAADAAGDVVRWAVFSCVLVPVVLLWYGTSPAGAAGTALGLAAVTAACRYLLRRSERGRRGRHGAASRGGGRHTRGTAPDPRRTTPVD